MIHILIGPYFQTFDKLNSLDTCELQVALFRFSLRVCVIMQGGLKLAHADFLMGPLATRVYHL